MSADPAPSPGITVGLWALELAADGLDLPDRPDLHAHLAAAARGLLGEGVGRVVLPVGTSRALDPLAAELPGRVELTRVAPGGPVGYWLVAGTAAYDDLPRAGLPVDVLTGFAGRTSVYQPGDVETTSSAVLNLQQAVAGAAGRAVPYLDWTPDCERWQAALRPAGRPAARPARPGPPRIALVMWPAYRGGVWEAVRLLVRHLGERLGRGPAAYRLTLAVAPDQDLAGLDPAGVPVERVDWEVVPRYRVTWAHPPAGLPAGAEFVRPRSPGVDAADALFFLTDRFFRPLPPRVPYAVWVYDMIQEHAPACFDRVFWEVYRAGMIPTVGRAALAVVPSEPVAAAARAAYGLGDDRLRVIPVACQPGRRFAGVDPVPPPAPRPGRPFVLHLANAAPHKGARPVLRAAAALRDRLGPAAPPVVLCGAGTERFSAAFRDTAHPAWWYVAEVQRLWQGLGLREGADVFFLGDRPDPEVVWLYRRAAAVVNAGEYDNGSFNLVEGHHFGRPLVSTDYPAARALAGRFRLPVRFVPLGDPAALAGALAEAADRPPPTADALTRIRADLADPEFTEGTHAERVHEVLVELARRAAAG